MLARLGAFVRCFRSPDSETWESHYWDRYWADLGGSLARSLSQLSVELYANLPTSW